MRLTGSPVGLLALAVAVTSVGCGQTSSDAKPHPSGGTPATGGIPATGSVEGGGGQSDVVPAGGVGGAGGEEGTVLPPAPETTFRLVNGTDAAIYVQLPTAHTLTFSVSGEYNGTPEWDDDPPFCMDCPRDTCPLYEQTLRTVEAIEPGQTWERVWDGYLFTTDDEGCFAKRVWRGSPHNVQICWGASFTSDQEQIVTDPVCGHEPFLIGDTVVHTVTN